MSAEATLGAGTESCFLKFSGNRLQRWFEVVGAVRAGNQVVIPFDRFTIGVLILERLGSGISQSVLVNVEYLFGTARGHVGQRPLTEDQFTDARNEPWPFVEPPTSLTTCHRGQQVAITGIDAKFRKVGVRIRDEAELALGANQVATVRLLGRDVKPWHDVRQQPARPNTIVFVAVGRQPSQTCNQCFGEWRVPHALIAVESNLGRAAGSHRLERAGLQQFSVATILMALRLKPHIENIAGVTVVQDHQFVLRGTLLQQLDHVVMQPQMTGDRFALSERDVVGEKGRTLMSTDSVP